MEFRIADTFTDSLAKLTGDEQKAVKTTAFDLQVNPAHPSMQFHRLDRAKDKNFWSIRVSRDIRVIVHKTASSLMLCYVDHHDPAYRWAERRRLERHPTTGAAQLVEVRETIREIEVPRYVDADVPAATLIPKRPVPPKALFKDVPDDELIGYGVPPEWLPDVREAIEETFLQLADHLPAEAAEALLTIATGGTPAPPVHADAESDPFAHPDAQRRFRVMTDADELARALEFPWDKWTIFLHPAQRQMVEREFAGPARVAGSAGTGKTIVALHRAVHLARKHGNARVLLATFSEPLANALRVKLRRLIGEEPRLGERLEVSSMERLGRRLYEANVGRLNVATEPQVRALLTEAGAELDARRFGPRFLWTEWSDIVDAWQLADWESYRDVRRLGRKTRLAEGQRAALWKVFEQVRAALVDQGLVTLAGVFGRLTEVLPKLGHLPYDFAVIDEAQDVGVAELRFLAALGANRPDSLFFAGDLGQRIFQQPFSWKSLGVDIRGRSTTLRINYRTSHQIRIHADRLLATELSDVDGVNESRRGTVSVFNGPDPMIGHARTVEAERDEVARQLRDWREDGIAPHEIAVFVRSETELARAEAAVKAAEAPYQVVGKEMETTHGKVTISPMHQAKGLEFRAVVVMARSQLHVQAEDRADALGFLLVDDQRAVDDVEAERRRAAGPLAAAPGRQHLVARALRDLLALELREAHQDVQRQLAHRRRRVERLRDRHERRAMLLEERCEAREVD